MNIAFITNTFDNHRGGNKVFADLFRELGGEHRFTIITNKMNTEDNNWNSHIINTRQFFYQPWVNDHLFSRGVINKFEEIHKKENFDLIIINQIVGAPILKINKFKIPTIYMIHHPASVDIQLAKDESESLLEKIKWSLRYGYIFSIQKKLVKKFNNILTVSNSSKERIIKDYGVGEEKIHVIFNGIDTDFFKKTKDTRKKTVIALGSYQHPRRGFKYLIKIYRKLSELGFTIIDVGRRSTKHSTILSTVPNIEQKKVVGAQELPDLYSQASVFISTSLFEGFGLAVCESLACETPVVVFSAGGSDEILNKISPQSICEPRNIEQMVEKILEAEDADKNHRELREFIINNFGMNRMAESYNKYFKLLSSTSS